MDGILLVDKPGGLTSHDVVNAVRKIVLTKKVGHAGTLDPFATGLLIVGFNQGTKLLTFLQGSDKEYEATLRLGIETDTLDRDGRVVREMSCPDITRPDAERILGSFIGRQGQIPPRYSAIKKEGVPLYRLARKGEEFEPQPRDVEVFDIRLTGMEPPFLSFSVRCSSGTYVRSLARDIAMRMGCCGHLDSLRRTRSGNFVIDMAVPLERLKAGGEGWKKEVVGLRDALSLQEFAVGPEIAGMIRTGRELAVSDISLEAVETAGKFMITCNGELVAVAEEGAGRRLVLLRVFNPPA